MIYLPVAIYSWDIIKINKLNGYINEDSVDS